MVLPKSNTFLGLCKGTFLSNYFKTIDLELFGLFGMIIAIYKTGLLGMDAMDN
jgi:hypothetical protein